MKDGRILGLDLLRGLAALSVAVFHVLHWEDSTRLYNLSQGSVYIFFILSGASMTIAYADAIRGGMGWGRFVALRFFRLAPLYWPLVLLVLALSIYHRGPTLQMFSLTLLNLSYLFGFANPASTSMSTGAWSLGIEFVFYFLFPAFMALLAGKRRPYVIFLVLYAAQTAFVHAVIGEGRPWEETWPIYCQFIAFIGYFFAGCLIGKIYRKDEFRLSAWHPAIAWIIFCGGIALILLTPSPSREAAISGGNGLMLSLNRIVLVMAAAYLTCPRWLGKIAVLAGAASYGLYLLHPWVYKVMERAGITGTLSAVDTTLLVIAITTIAALLVERYWEQPIKRYGYRLLKREG